MKNAMPPIPTIAPTMIASALPLENALAPPELVLVLTTVGVVDVVVGTAAGPGAATPPDSGPVPLGSTGSVAELVDDAVVDEPADELCLDAPADELCLDELADAEPLCDEELGGDEDELGDDEEAVVDDFEAASAGAVNSAALGTAASSAAAASAAARIRPADRSLSAPPSSL